MRTIVLLIVIALCACNTIPKDDNFAAVQTARSESLKACAESSDVAACMLGVSLSFATGPQYQRAPTAMETTGNMLIGGLKVVMPGLVSLGGQYASIEVEKLRAGVESQRATMLERMFTEQAQAGAAPDLIVGGNYGDTFTDNSTHGDTISDSGNSAIDISDSGNGNAGRDLIGGDRIDNAGNIGSDNRQDSPGPIDNSDPGDDCSGASCNPTEQPEG